MIAGLTEIVGADRILKQEPMSRHTTFRIGGPADWMILPQNESQIQAVIHLLKENKYPYLVLGNGSNILVGDKGIRGAVIQLGNEFADCRTEGDALIAQAGIKLSRLANVALQNGLSGLEFAAGIPGTLGGAIYMNAGAYGGEMADVIASVTYLNPEGEICTVNGATCGFGYRTSIFAKNDYVILSCKLQLKNGDSDAIRAVMDDLQERRTSKQPLHLPSAGSTFKRPEGYFAGKLIQDAGLMGFRVGGASVSEKHAGFVVNDKGATANDVRTLVEAIQRKVKAEFGVTLEPEVKFIGEF
ncbi:MAG: UDP-N-acetylmuramate dehydrogenase [Clostridia bacterium]|nr:UDP-N-acetylmuramate dehydrogenase [Clostridia bacterium]